MLTKTNHRPVTEFWCFAFFLASNLSCSSLTTLNTVSARKTQRSECERKPVYEKSFSNKRVMKTKENFCISHLSKVFACAFSMYPTNFESPPPTSSVCPNTRTEKHLQLNLYSHGLYETVFYHELIACENALQPRMGRRESGKKEDRRECSYSQALFTG